MTHKPRLLYVDDIPTPYRFDVFRQVARDWPGAFQVAFCAASEPGRTFEIDFSGVDTRILDGGQWRPPWQANPFSFKWNPGITRLLEEFEPDVVVLSGYTHPTMMRAARWCISHGVPYGITCETNAHVSSVKGLRWQLRRRAIGWMVRKMAFGLPTGREAASYLSRLGATNAPMYFFPNTPNTELFESAATEAERSGGELGLSERLGLQADDLIFTFVGRLIEAKRPLDAVSAFVGIGANLNASLLVVGDGPLMAEARRLASDDPRIVFVGWISDRAEVARILAASDALVLPSSHEPWGAVVNEAMAAGTPVIATDRVGAARELIEQEVDGFIVPVGNVAAIQRAMRILVEDRERSRTMGKAAQRKAVGQGAHFAAGNLLAAAQASLDPSSTASAGEDPQRINA